MEPSFAERRGTMCVDTAGVPGFWCAGSGGLRQDAHSQADVLDHVRGDLTEGRKCWCVAYNGRIAELCRGAAKKEETK